MRANRLGCLQRGGLMFPQPVIVCRLLLMVPSSIRGASKDNFQELGENRTSESSTPSIKFCDIPLFHRTCPLLLYC